MPGAMAHSATTRVKERMAAEALGDTCQQNNDGMMHFITDRDMWWWLAECFPSAGRQAYICIPLPTPSIRLKSRLGMLSAVRPTFLQPADGDLSRHAVNLKKRTTWCGVSEVPPTSGRGRGNRLRRVCGRRGSAGPRLRRRPSDFGRRPRFENVISAVLNHIGSSPCASGLRGRMFSSSKNSGSSCGCSAIDLSRLCRIFHGNQLT